MSDREAFLRAIRAEPDDDTVRLAFADWLDEHGEPQRAEFIRVQVELDPVRYRIDNPRAAELHRREDELLRAHGDEWIGTDHLLTNPADFGPVFRRGFPDYACLSLDTFLQNGEALFAAHPTLREVALYGLANRCSELTMSPLLARLDALEIADWPTEDDAISLSVSPHLDRIKAFKLWWSGNELHFLHALARQAIKSWPREIELIQVCGGVGDWPESADTYDDTADSVAYTANKRLGRDAVRVTRPFERLFPLKGEVGKNIRAGHLPDGRPALAAGSFYDWVLVVFAGDGRVAEVARRQSPVSEPETEDHESEAEFSLSTAFVEWANEGLRLRPGLIWVREFRLESVGIELFTSHNRERVMNPSPHPPPTWLGSVWHEFGGQVRGWLEHRNFVINWIGAYTADWRGIIHSS